MRFADLADAFERLEATSKRLEMRKILVELVRPLKPPELTEVLFLAQGVLRPEYEGVELGVADSLARRAIALVTGAAESEVAARAKRLGDLGLTVAELLPGVSRSQESPLTVTGVYAELTAIAGAKGEGSQELKVRTLHQLLERASPLEAKYLVRFVLGTLRVGVRELTLLDALNEAFTDGSKGSRARIEAAFNLCSDLGMVAGKLVEGGADALASIHLTVGRPVRPMLAEREPTLEKVLERMGGRAALEYKYDGLRVQAHVARDGSVRLFSRRLEEIGPQFPELLEELPKAVHRTPSIVEGECVPVDLDTGALQPFQEISHRRGRKHDLAKATTEIPVVLFLFDVLLAAGEPTLERPFPERRCELEALIRPTERVRLAEQRVVDSVEQATDFFDRALSDGAEGVMAKSIRPESPYRAGARGFTWIKYKRDYTAGLADSIDGVVVGAFQGRGRRAGRYGAFLLAVYDKKRDRFESFCKVGSGFDDAQLADMPKQLKPLESADPIASVDTGLVPDRWFRPGIVLEVQGAELTLSPIHRAAFGAVRPGVGLALRFPRFTGRFRSDKSPTEATTSHELLEMYRSQVRQVAETTSDADSATS